MPLIKYTLTAVLFMAFSLTGVGTGATQGQTVTAGSIQGVLLDPDSKPISDATVYALPEEDMRNSVADATTDSAGKFTLHGLPAGVIYILAHKESDGYPNSLSAFFSPDGHPPAVVTLGAGQVVTGLNVKLGARAAYLKFNVTDENGSRLAPRLRFTRDDQPGQYYGTSSSGDETVLVPSVPFRLTVEADGYAPWHYGGANYAGKAGLITLKSGQTLKLDVKLRRAR